jgi:hypothetical protein
MGDKGKIIYALVAKGTTPLSGYSNYTGTFDQNCINYLPKVGPGTSAAVKIENDYVIYYMNEINITYMIMTDGLYPKEAAVGCLESIKKEFQSNITEQDLEGITSFGLDNKFKTKLRMKFDYFNENTDISNEAIGHLKEEMSKMKDEVLTASGLLDERGTKMQNLDDKADSLSRSSNNFYSHSKKVKRAELMKKYKLIGGILLVVILIIVIIVLIAK